MLFLILRLLSVTIIFSFFLAPRLIKVCYVLSLYSRFNIVSFVAYSDFFYYHFSILFPSHLLFCSFHTLIFRLSESMRIIEIKAATHTLSVIKAAKLKNLLIPNEIDIEQRNSQTTQVSDLISTFFICGVVLCTVV